MEDLLTYIREVLSSFGDLATFEPFTNQAARKVYDEMRNGDSGTPEKLFPENIFSGEIRDTIGKGSYTKPLKGPRPEYDIQPKKVKCIINPKTGRKIYKGGHLYDELLKDGWIDENGNHLKTYKVRRVVNPKTGKSITVGTKRFLEIVGEGWLDDEGNILKVFAEDRSEIRIESRAFKTLVKNGVYNADGTRTK